jgi:hypothetical protein
VVHILVAGQKRLDGVLGVGLDEKQLAEFVNVPFGDG